MEQECRIDHRRVLHSIIKKELIRPTDSTRLRGDARRAKRLLDWEPTVKCKGPVGIMVVADLKLEAEESRKKNKPYLCPAWISPNRPQR